jgi:hypothetical protein
VIVMRTQLLVLMLFGFLNVFCAMGVASGGGDRSLGEHMGGAGASEGVGSPGTSYSEATGDEKSGGFSLSFRYEPACSSFTPPGTANSAAPFGAGGTGLNDLSCNEDYVPFGPPSDQQAGEIGFLGNNPDEPKLVPPTNQSKGITEVNPDQ